jgi:hypothetical protein
MKPTSFPYLLCLLFSLSLSLEGRGQENFRRQAVFVELLGSGVFGSVNYDFRFKPGNDGLGLRAGIGAIPSGIVFPFGLSGLVGKKRVTFEYGAGITAALITGPITQDLTFTDGLENFGVIGFANAGIRFTPTDNGLLFKLNWNPMFNSEGPILGWFGLGVGYSWKKELE